MKELEKPSDRTPWTIIESERRHDRLIRGVSVVAWSVTFLLLLAYAAMVGSEVLKTMDRVLIGLAHHREIYQTLMPMVAVVGAISLLIAMLSTVGVFLRFRTASLAEIQLRLAALEQILAATPDPEDDGSALVEQPDEPGPGA